MINGDVLLKINRNDVLVFHDCTYLYTCYLLGRPRAKPWSDCVKGKLKSTPACHLAMHVGREDKSTAIEYVQEKVF